MEATKSTLSQLKEQPHYSYTALNAYINTCQLLYYYRYIEKAEAERTPVALPFGSAFHSVLSEQAQAAKTVNLLTAEQMTEAFATYFQANCKDAVNIVFKRDENMEDQITTAKRMFEAVNKEWTDYWNIQSVAEPFMIEMPGLSKPIIGELDMVISEQTPFDDENDKGFDTIVDFKTAARMWPEDKSSKDLQATVFSYAFEKVHGRRPSFRFDIVTKTRVPAVRHLSTSLCSWAQVGLLLALNQRHLPQWSFRPFLRTLLLLAPAALLAAWGARWVTQALLPEALPPPLSRGLLLLFGAAATSALYLLLSLALGRREPREVLRSLRRHRPPREKGKTPPTC